MTQVKDKKSLSVSVTDNREARLDHSFLPAKKVWLALFVKIHHEQRISKRLTACGIENFVAIQQQHRQWSDRIKLVNHVVLPMVVFVCVTPVQRRQVLQIPFVIRYIVACGSHSPAVIPSEQMEKFKFMLDYSAEAVNILNIPIKQGEKVRIIKGPLVGMIGVVVTVKSEKKVGICLDGLGYACVTIPSGYLEAII